MQMPLGIIAVAAVAEVVTRATPSWYSCAVVPPHQVHTHVIEITDHMRFVGTDGIRTNNPDGSFASNRLPGAGGDG